MDFKKLRKSSSKKLIKGGLGFFLSPREESKDITSGSSSTSKDIQLLSAVKKNNWESDTLKLEQNETEVQSKDYIDDIPVITSLDDFVDDDLTSQIAKAPLVGVKRVTTYKEPENDILRHSAFTSLEEVNLRILTKLLHPESCLEEPDTPWTKDGLFYEVVSKANEQKV